MGDPYPPFAPADGDASPVRLRFAERAQAPSRAANQVASRPVLGPIFSNGGAIQARLGDAVRERNDQFSKTLGRSVMTTIDQDRQGPIFSNAARSRSRIPEIIGKTRRRGRHGAASASITTLSNSGAIDGGFGGPRIAGRRGRQERRGRM